MARKHKEITYRCPHCGNKIETLVPFKKDVGPTKVFWDSMIKCPLCNKLHFKTIWPNGRIAVMFEVKK